MQNESRQAHWEGVYTQKGESEVGWFQENPAPSLELIKKVGATARFGYYRHRWRHLASGGQSC